MAQLIRVRPVPGRTVLHPETRRPIDDSDGRLVPATGEVLRAIRRGDLDAVDTAAPGPTAVDRGPAPAKPRKTED